MFFQITLAVGVDRSFRSSGSTLDVSPSIRHTKRVVEGMFAEILGLKIAKISEKQGF